MHLGIANAAGNEWTWLKGSKVTYQPGIYGTQGIPNQANTPGAREGSISWTDSSDNLWLFGGEGAVGNDWGVLNDLWKYDPLTSQWTWVKGSNILYQTGVYGTRGEPAPNNNPGARKNSISWTDHEGNLWLFGGIGNAASSTWGALNDLWKYNPTTNQWTWMKGSDSPNQYGTYGIQGTPASANTPGARYDSVSWTDSAGNLWLFGGIGKATSDFYNSGDLNDLWKYDPATNQWTWIKGSSATNQSGVYGTQGIPDPANTPRGRSGSVSWKDSVGNLWLFGGYSQGTGSDTGNLNDLWKYDPATNQWTWVKGSDASNQPGIYGSQGIAAPANTPGARSYFVSWTDIAGNLWLFGGSGQGASDAGTLNDLWKYTPSTNQWAWIKGSDSPNQNGIFGIQGVPDSSNTPGARAYYPVSWSDSIGNLWLFAGCGYWDNLDDLWKYTVNYTTAVQTDWTLYN